MKLRIKLLVTINISLLLNFIKLTAENFTTRLEANLVTKTDFDKKLRSFNRKIASNKTKYLEDKRKLNSVITNNYSFFLG